MAKPQILVVDDDRVTRQLTRAALVKAGYGVGLARDGIEALARLRAKTFALVLLDVWMPRLDGLGVLERLAKMKAAPKVVVMTSDETPETVLKAIRRRANQYVHKPIDPAALVTLVRETLQRGVEPPLEVVSARPDWVE